MAEKRIVDIGPLLEDLKNELEDLKGATEVLTVEEAAEDEIEELKKLLVIDPKKMIPAWRDPDKDPPKVETEVLVLYRCNGYLGITTAHYENGNVFSEDSEWNWEDLSDWGTYDEERDDYRIPEGWWEYRHFNPDDVYNNKIDCPVVGWMPLPPEEAAEDEIEELKKLLVIDPKKMIPAWRDPDKDPPKVETEVLVLYRCNGYLGITTAHYENGNVFSEDSEWNWEDLSDWGTYDEERDDYRIPEGWWEYRHFNPDDVYNNKIDCPVVGWMPLPPEEAAQNGNQ